MKKEEVEDIEKSLFRKKSRRRRPRQGRRRLYPDYSTGHKTDTHREKTVEEKAVRARRVDCHGQRALPCEEMYQDMSTRITTGYTARSVLCEDIIMWEYLMMKK